jgi:hypothetical protein
MEFITSRSDQILIPQDNQGMEKENWFNMWERRNFPYNELVVGDILYWLETKTQKIVWKTKVVFIDRYRYTNKAHVFLQFSNSINTRYYVKRPESGYLFHYKVKAIERLDIPKPKGFRFPQLGWLRLDEQSAKEWFGNQHFVDHLTLDDCINSEIKNLNDKLIAINQQMANVAPRRIKQIVLTTIRDDTKIIKALKKAANYRCQFPGCGKRILKKNGSYYVEVAHITPVAADGKSILGNLIVMCPNHHKEFDYGKLIIHKQTFSQLSGHLNEIPFEIHLTNKDKI